VLFLNDSVLYGYAYYYYKKLGIKENTDLVHKTMGQCGSIDFYHFNLIYIHTQNNMTPFIDNFPGDWEGRVVLCGENSTKSQWNTQVNRWSDITGMSIVNGDFDDGTNINQLSEPEDVPLTAGVSGLYHDLSSRITGGTPIVRLLDNDEPFISHNKVDAVDWVVSADLNWGVSNLGNTWLYFSPQLYGGTFEVFLKTDNARFVKNLLTVPI
jgi:hypothetical protein